MAEDKNILAAFLRNTLLFSNLDDELFTYLVNTVQVKALKPGDLLYSEGDDSQDFYLVWSGKLNWFRSGSKGRELGTYIIGDYFGEDWLVSDYRLGTIEALETTKVFVFERALMEDIFLQLPKLKKLLSISAKSRRMAYQKRLQWLGENEAPYFIARKHPFFLGFYLILPVLFLLVSAFFLFGSLMNFEFQGTQFWLPGCLNILAILWVIWVVVDWGNDFYVVTSQRVTWAEKTIAIYDSRQEAPLDTILTINKISNQTLRLFIDYGTIIVKTYTGSIVMRWSRYPDEMMVFIDGFKSRARAIARQDENVAMEEMIRTRLGISMEQAEITRQVKKPAPQPASEKSFANWLRNALKLRYVEGDSITYRKHWFILLKKTFFPALVTLGLIAAAIFLYVNGIFTGPLAIFLWLLILLVSGFWWFYQYLDWRNDVYILTLEKILDIERKPFTREEKKEASLANILSLENSRVGILGLLLNFGTVTINVGIEKLTFDYVLNPVQVQFEISDRMYALRRRKEEAEAFKERERIADWLMAYHKQIGRLEDFERKSNDDDISG